MFLLMRMMTTDKVLDDLKGIGGTVVATLFDHAKAPGPIAQVALKGKRGSVLALKKAQNGAAQIKAAENQVRQRESALGTTQGKLSAASMD